MSDQYLIQLTDTNNRSTTVLLDDGYFSDTWSQGILGPAMLIGSGHGTFTMLGAARRVNLWDGQDHKQLVVMDQVARYPFRVGDSGDGLFGGSSPVLHTGPITWQCLSAY